LPPVVASPKLARHRFGAAPRDAPKRRSRIIAIATYNKWEGHARRSREPFYSCTSKRRGFAET
jgi:hypothetical protein